MDPFNLPLRFVTFDNARKRYAKTFLHWECYNFFQKICFQQHLRCYRNDLVTSPIIVRILLDPYNMPLRFLTLDNARKIRPKSFLHWAGCLFFQNSVFPTTNSLKKWSCNFHSKCQITLWSLISFSVTFIMFDDKRQIRPIYFFTGNFEIFSKNCNFNRLLGNKEMILYLAPKMPKYLVEPIIKVIACPS